MTDCEKLLNVFKEIGIVFHDAPWDEPEFDNAWFDIPEDVAKEIRRYVQVVGACLCFDEHGHYLGCGVNGDGESRHFRVR